MDWFGGTRNGCSQDTTNGWNGRQDRGPLLGRHVVYIHTLKQLFRKHAMIFLSPLGMTSKLLVAKLLPK